MLKLYKGDHIYTIMKNQNYNLLGRKDFTAVNLACRLMLIENKNFSTSTVNQVNQDNTTNNESEYFVLRNFVEGGLTEESVLSCDYITGFTDAEGSFSITIEEGKYSKPQVTLSFRVTQKDHSSGVLKDLQKFVGAGVVSKPAKRNQVVEFSVRKLDDILLKVIPFFDKYPLVTSKQLNFESFKKAAGLIVSGEYLTDEGINKIKELKANMNTGRSFEDKFRHC